MHAKGMALQPPQALLSLVHHSPSSVSWDVMLALEKGLGWWCLDPDSSQTKDLFRDRW